MVQLVIEQEEDQIETPIVITKAKAKRASKAKPAGVVEPEVEVTASLDEVEAVITLPLPEELKVDTKVACPDCGKQMSAKTLKYSHRPSCSSKKLLHEYRPRGRRVCKDVTYSKASSSRNRRRTRSKHIRGIRNVRIAKQGPRARNRAPHPNTSTSRASNSQGNDDEQTNAKCILIVSSAIFPEHKYSKHEWLI